MVLSFLIAKEKKKKIDCSFSHYQFNSKKGPAHEGGENLLCYLEFRVYFGVTYMIPRHSQSKNKHFNDNRIRYMFENLVLHMLFMAKGCLNEIRQAKININCICNIPLQLSGMQQVYESSPKVEIIRCNNEP